VRRATALGVGLWTTLPLLLIAGTGCSFPFDSGGCVPTEVESVDVATDDPDERVVLTGRLTSEGEPVEGADVQFRLFYTDESGEAHGRSIGVAETDADGLAELAYASADDLPGFSTDTVVAYQTQYSSIADTADYCSSSSEKVTLDVPCAGFACE
jgi:hypothetical protein